MLDAVPLVQPQVFASLEAGTVVHEAVRQANNCSVVASLALQLLRSNGHELTELFVELLVTGMISTVLVCAMFHRRVGNVQPPAFVASEKATIIWFIRRRPC